MKIEELTKTRIVRFQSSQNLLEQSIKGNHRECLELEMDLVPTSPLLEESEIEGLVVSVDDLLGHIGKGTCTQSEIESILNDFNIRPIDPRLMIIFDRHNSYTDNVATFWRSERGFCLMTFNSDHGKPEQETYTCDPLKIIWIAGWSILAVRK